MSVYNPRIKPGGLHVYRPTSYRYIPFHSFLLVWTGVIILFQFARLSETTVAWILFVVVIAYLNYHFVLNDHLVISSEGIKFVVQGTSGYTTWDNIHNIEANGLHTSAPIAVKHTLLKRIFSQQAFYGHIPAHFVIPVPRYRIGQVNLAAFAKTTFGREVLRYAPHLFGDVKVKRE